MSDINSQMLQHTVATQLSNSENIFMGGKNLFTAIGSLFGFVGSNPKYQVGYFCIPNSCHSLGTYYEK